MRVSALLCGKAYLCYSPDR